MRICAIINSKFFQNTGYINNRTDVTWQNIQMTKPLSYDSFEKTSFTAEQRPEDVEPSRKAFDKLPQEKLTCPCCGRVMIPPAEIEELKNKCMLRCSAKDAIKVLEKYENKMHSVEKEIFQMFKEEAKRNPEMNFKDMLNKWKPESEEKLIKTQFGIFTLLEKASENIDDEKKQKVKELIETEKAKILNGNNEFRRKHFVIKFEQIFADTEDSETKEHLIRLAKKLPTAYEDKNAFIVKYASHSPEEIGIRLLSYSMRTVEHVKPKNRHGENHLFNYIPECMRCNSFRSDRPMIQQLEEYPEMFANAQNLMDTMIKFANSRLISRWYIIKIRERIFEESDGVLDLDISKLEKTPAMSEYIKSKTLNVSENINSSKTKKQLRKEERARRRAEKKAEKRAEKEEKEKQAKKAREKAEAKRTLKKTTEK